MASQLLAILQQGLDVQEKQQNKELERALRTLELGTQVKMQQQKLDFEELEGERERGFTLTRDYIDDLQRSLELDVEADRRMDEIVYESTQERLIAEAGFKHEKQLTEFSEMSATERQRLKGLSDFEITKYGEMSATERQRLSDLSALELQEYIQESTTERDRLKHEFDVKLTGMGYAHAQYTAAEAERTASRQLIEANFDEIINTGKADAHRNKLDAFTMFTSKYNFSNLEEQADEYRDYFGDAAEDAGASETFARTVFDTVTNFQINPEQGYSAMESLLRQVEELYGIQSTNPRGKTAQGDQAAKDIRFLVSIGFLPPGEFQDVKSKGKPAVMYSPEDESAGLIPEGKQVGEVKFAAEEPRVLGNFYKSGAFENIMSSVTKNNEVINNLQSEWNERSTAIVKDADGNVLTNPDEIWKQRFLHQKATDPIRVDPVSKTKMARHEQSQKFLAELASQFDKNGTGRSKLVGMQNYTQKMTNSDVSDDTFRKETYDDLKSVTQHSGPMTVLLTTMKQYHKNKSVTAGKKVGMADIEAGIFVDRLRGIGPKGAKMTDAAFDVGEKDDSQWAASYFGKGKFADYMKDPAFWDMAEKNLGLFFNEKGQNNNIDWQYIGNADWWDWRGEEYQRERLVETLTNFETLKNAISSGQTLYNEWLLDDQEETDAFNSLNK